jgi:CheY-like chemotaxis protein
MLTQGIKTTEGPVALILVIDDEPLIRTLLRHALGSAGHEVTEAGDGAAGVQACREQQPDLVVCDLVMPIKSGLDVIRDLGREFPGVKVIAISGSAPQGMAKLLRVAQGLGAVRVLEKPFGIQQVRDAVAEVLRAG